MKRRNKNFLFGSIILIGLLFLVYEIRSIKLAVETVPPEIVLELINPTVKEKLKNVDPCFDIRFENDQKQRVINNMKQRKALVMADLSVEIELAKDGKVPIEKLAAILRKHDDTETKMYRKLYKDVW